MMRLWWIIWVAACQPLGDTTGDLAAHGAGQRVYWQMKLDDVGVKRDRARWADERMPTKIHALRSMPHETTEELSLSATVVNLNTTIDLANVIFSWHDNRDNTYTCHLHDVSLGAQRGIRGNGIDNATFCFAQKNAEGDYVRLLADHCVSASKDGESRFIFLGGRDFACDLSEKRDKSLLLQASCLAKGDKSCLGGKIRACAENNKGAFDPFIAEFKDKVNTSGGDTNTEDNYSITYELKNDEDDLCTTPQPAQTTPEQEAD